MEQEMRRDYIAQRSIGQDAEQAAARDPALGSIDTGAASLQAPAARHAPVSAGAAEGERPARDRRAVARPCRPTAWRIGQRAPRHSTSGMATGYSLWVVVVSCVIGQTRRLSGVWSYL